MQFRYLSMLAPAFASIASAWPMQKWADGALYVLNNDPSGSTVIAMPVWGGYIQGEACQTSTGGVGAISVNSSGDPMGADPLGSQGSVVVYGNMLFTVNAGSNTVSMFAINPSNPMELSMIGNPAPSGGDFPMSLDYSPALQQLCVLNGGSDASVTCFDAHPWNGLTQAGMPRSLSKMWINETTPPNGPPGSAAQILFNPQSTALFVTLKGIPMMHNGYTLVYPVGQQGQVNDTPVVSQFDNVALPFGFQFLDVDTIFLTDPSFGVSLLQVNPDWSLTQTAHTPVAGQEAICWTVADQELQTLYAIDSGVNSLWTFDYNLTQKAPINFTEPMNEVGLFDSVLADNVFYSLTASPGIITLNLTSGDQSYADLSMIVKERNYLTGMACWGW